MHFICHSNINVKRHLNRSNLHLNDNGISALVRNFKNFLNNFESVWLQSKHNLLTTGHGSLSSENSESCFSINNDILRIRKERIDNALNTIIGDLNINSIRNKFVLVENIIKAFDIFLISESKLDCTFPLNQFHIAGFKQFRRDRNRFGGGLMLYINENIPCRPLNEHPKFPDLELIVFELHQSKHKSLFLGIYKPLCQNEIHFLHRINSILDHYLTTYENFILIGDFNLCVENAHLEATLWSV